MASKPKASQPGESQYALDFYIPERQEILKKPVEAVHMSVSGGLLTKTQRVAWNALLKHAHLLHAKDPNLKVDTYSIPRRTLMEAIGYTSGNRKHLKVTLTQMQTYKCQWDIHASDGNPLWASCVLLPMVGFDDDFIYWSFAPQIKPLLLDPIKFARLDLAVQRKLKSDSAAALYEYVARYQGIKKTVSLPWETWRTIIYGTVEPDSMYQEYKMFKRRKLLPAVDEINELSEFVIELVELKNGTRRVTDLMFRIALKEQAKPTLANEPSKKTDILLESLGLSDIQRKKIVARYTPAQIQAAYDYTMKRDADTSQEKVKDLGAYFRVAIENEYAAVDAESEPESPAPVQSNPMAEIQTAFNSQRTDEATGLFAELNESEQEALLAEYNAEQTSAAAKIPSTRDKRKNRHMIPFYVWYAKRTWGEPSHEELFAFGITNGYISVKL